VSECWAVKSQQESKFSVTDIRMLCWMGGFVGKNRIRNTIIRKKIRIIFTIEKIVESRLCGLGTNDREL